MQQHTWKMEQKRIVISMAEDQEIAEAIAAELSVSLVQCTFGEALTYVKSEADNILAFVLPNKFIRRYIAWVYRKNSFAPHVLYVEDGDFSLRQLNSSAALLKGKPSVEDLGEWVNQELLPKMGFQPLAMAYHF